MDEDTVIDQSLHSRYPLCAVIYTVLAIIPIIVMLILDSSNDDIIALGILTIIFQIVWFALFAIGRFIPLRDARNDHCQHWTSLPKILVLIAEIESIIKLVSNPLAAAPITAMAFDVMSFGCMLQYSCRIYFHNQGVINTPLVP